MKRIIALLLCVIMLITCASSCAKKAQSDDSVTNDGVTNDGVTDGEDSTLTKIVWGVSRDGMKDTYYVNELLKEKGYPYELEVKAIEDDDYIAGIEAAKNAGEQIDILDGGWINSGADGYTFHLLDIIKGGYCISIDDYLSSDAGDAIKQVYPEKTLNAAKINGTTYHIPNPFVPPWTFILYWDKELAEKYNLDMTKLQDDISLIEEYAKTVYDGECGRENFYVSTTYDNGIWIKLNERLMCFNYIEVDCSVQPPQARFVYDSEYFAETNEMLERMYNYGCIPSFDKIDYDTPFTTFFEIELALSENEFQEIRNTDGKYGYIVYDTEPLTYQYAYKGNVITSWSDHPDEAFELLSIVMTDPEINNALTYGVLDKDYKIIDGRAYDVSGADVYILDDSFYNLFVALPRGSNTNSKETLYKAYEEMEVSPIAGFVFDTESVQTEIDALEKIYFDNIDNQTSMAYISNIEGIKQEMYNAGLEKVLDEVNRQLEEWWEKQ